MVHGYDKTKSDLELTAILLNKLLSNKAIKGCVPELISNLGIITDQRYREVQPRYDN